MLVLARRKRESVVVGSPSGLERMLKVTVLEINDESVLLGLEAHQDFPVQPWELWEQFRVPQSPDSPETQTTRRRFWMNK